MALESELIALLEPLAAEHGLELVAADAVGGSSHQTVRVFLDRTGGIDIDSIAEANEWISAALDTVQRLSGPYTLEVSSPGIERPLRTRAHFERFAGSTAVVHTARPIDGRSRFTGAIVAVDGDDIVLDVDGSERRVPFDIVERARLKADFGEMTEGNGS
jgi:ribosome maturation factor RimP